MPQTKGLHIVTTRRPRGGDRDLVNDWRVIHSAVSTGIPGDREAFLEKHLGVRRLFSSMYSDGKGLGAQMRWSAILSEIAFHDSNGVEMKRDDVRQELRIQQRDFLQLGNLDCPRDSWYGRRVLLDETACNPRYIDNLCRWLSDPGICKLGAGARKFTVDDFWIPAKGPHAVRNYLAHFTDGLVPLASDGHLVPPCKLELSPEQGRAVDKLIAELARPHSGRPVLPVYAKSFTLMRAAAHELLRRLEADATEHRAVLLLPCSRHTPPYDYVGTDFLVYNLSNFFYQKPLSAEPPALSRDEYAQRLQFVRSSLSSTPAVIGLVGFHDQTSAYPRIARAIRDDFLPELLEQLSLADVGESGNPRDAAAFQRSRFIVFTDSCTDNVLGASNRSIDIPCFQRESDKAFVREVIQTTGAGKANESHVSKLLEGLESTSVEVAESTVGAYLQLLSLEETHLGRVASPFPELVRFGGAGVWNRLISTIKDHATALDLLVLRLIALTDAGIRGDTVLRCLNVWVKATSGRVIEQRHLVVQMPPEGVPFSAWLKQFRERWRYVVAEGIDEYDPDLAGPPQGVPAQVRERSLVIRDAEVRESLLRDLHADAAWTATLAHRIIAAEALRQQITLLQCAPRDRRLALRSHRRAIEAFLHGVLSLPPLESGVMPDDATPTGLFGILPDDPAERFRFIHTTLMHRILESSSARALSHQWSADGLKLELLSVLHSAFEPCPRRMPRPFSKPPLWVLTPALAERLLPLLDEHLAAVAVAATRVGDRSAWSGVEQSLGLWKEPLPADSPITFSILERCKFDMAQANGGDEAGEALFECEGMVERLGVDIRAFERGPWSLPGTREPVVPTMAQWNALLAYLSAVCGSVRTEDLRAFANLMTRLADRRFDAIDSFRSNFNFRWHRAFEAFAMMEVAGNARARLYDADPYNNGQLGSRRAARVLACAGMEAVRLMLTPRKHQASGLPDTGPPEVAVHIASKVRQALNWYALDSSGDAPDDVTLLILEARYARTAGVLSNASTLERHTSALEYLRRAEYRLVEFNPAVMIRLRLLVERAATLRGLAQYHASIEPTGGKVALFTELAEADVVRLENLFADTFLLSGSVRERSLGSTWRRVVSHQRSMMDELRRNPKPRP